MPKDKNRGQSLLPELVQVLPGQARIIRDALNLADYPLALFGPRQKTKGIFKATVYRNGKGQEITVIGNEQEGVEVLYGHELDFLYGLISMFHDKYRAGPRELLFPLEHLIERANRTKTGPEYKRACRTLTKFRWLVIRKTGPVITNEGEMKFVQADLPPIVELFAICGSLRRGRKKSLECTKDGYCRVMFSEWFMSHLQNEELSTPLNFDFMMNISTPLGRRYFRLINSMRNRDGAIEIVKDLHDISGRIPLADTYPSHIKRILDPVHNELIGLSYLKGVEYGSENGSALITYRFSKFNVSQAFAIQELVSRGVASQTAEELASARPVKFILDVARLFDFLRQERKVSSAGWLVKTIETAEPASIEQSLERYDESTRKKRSISESREKARLRSFYAQEMRDKVAEARKNLTAPEMSGYEARAKEIVPINPALGERFYKLAIESSVEDLIRADLKLPSFDAWCSDRHETARLTNVYTPKQSDEKDTHGE